MTERTNVGAVDADRASHTAVLVCQGRAVAHGRMAEGRFADPTAMTLLREDERVPVRRVWEGTVPNGWAARLAFEMLRATTEVLVPRTVAIDDAVRARLADQLVIVGAGLDGRAWRMPELAGVRVFEVDHPASQRDKRDRAARRCARPLRGGDRLLDLCLRQDISVRPAEDDVDPIVIALDVELGADPAREVELQEPARTDGPRSVADDSRLGKNTPVPRPRSR